MRAMLLFLSALPLSCGPTDPPSDEVDLTQRTETLEPRTLPGIDRLHTLGGVYLASQPDPAGFQAAKDGGVRTVINLRHHDETEFDEAAIVEGLGLEYMHLPWNGPEELTDDVFDGALDMLESAEKPVLLHCKSANRVGAIWVTHRVLHDGLDTEAALEEARTVGLKTPGYEAKALDYIERKKR